jgi:hypothetical protein
MYSTVPLVHRCLHLGPQMSCARWGIRVAGSESDEWISNDQIIPTTRASESTDPANLRTGGDCHAAHNGSAVTRRASARRCAASAQAEHPIFPSPCLRHEEIGRADRQIWAPPIGTSGRRAVLQVFGSPSIGGDVRPPALWVGVRMIDRGAFSSSAAEV